jgi:glycerophosphoryl diester phosphodiesterase
MIPLPASFLNRPLAHRALHDVTDGRPENSRAAIRAAIAAGYGIEIDLQMSQDAQPMVFHDYDMARLTGQKGPIQLVHSRDLSRVKLTGGDEGIPGFEEVLDLVNGAVPLLVEVKDQDGGMGPNVGALERAAAPMIAAYPGDIAVMSFNPYSVACMRELLPETPRGLTTCRFRKPSWPMVKKTVRHALRKIPDFHDVGASFISHDQSDLHRKYVSRIKAEGHPVLTWTIKSADQETIARTVADNITFEGYLA